MHLTLHLLLFVHIYMYVCCVSLRVHKSFFLSLFFSPFIHFYFIFNSSGVYLVLLWFEDEKLWVFKMGEYGEKLKEFWID